VKLLIVLQHRLELWNAPSWFVEKLRWDFPEVEIVHLSTYHHADQHFPGAEVVVTWSLRPEQFNIAKKLRWIHSPAAAVHQLMFPDLINSDVILTNAREIHAPVVAEHALALLLSFAKKLPDAVRLQQKRLWGQENLWHSRPRPRELAGATLGIVGLGSIGRVLARHATGLGMRVIAVREHPQDGELGGVVHVFSSLELHKLLGESDYVVLAAPVTAATRSMMNAAALAKMKPDACLINVSRGALVDEAALISALREKRIGGAALDVFEEEPLPPESPLWDLENLLVTPHTAGMTDKLWNRHYAQISENLRRYLSREPLLSVVDKHKGY
jgi:phosphoglycerate dehydrogenase-like enzyme